MVTASDLVGCRYRWHQKQVHGLLPPTAAQAARAQRLQAARELVATLIPGAFKKSPRAIRRIDLGSLPATDIDSRILSTYEAIAAGYSHITGAVLEDSAAGWQVSVDLLLREADGSYSPVIVSNHRVARPDPRRSTLGVATSRLGLSELMALPYRWRHHAVDGYRLAMAARALAQLGVDSGRGGVIGQDRNTCFFTETGGYQEGFEQAYAALISSAHLGPRRVKECASCQFWQFCQPQLEAADDISLLLPGDRADGFRAQGITTVAELIASDAGEPAALARAWRRGLDVLRREQVLAPPPADIEVDIDMEAYLDQGAYLWGTWYRGQYRPFVSWEPLGARAEAANFQQFWQWLMALREQAAAQGKTFAAYCYAAHGENHWMRMSAERFGSPALAQVEEFIASPQWIDMFSYVKSSLAGPHGLGLKIVAPAAGYQWSQGDFDGEESVNARRRALSGDPATRQLMRQRLLAYNEDDVRATAAVRQWLRAGAPGVPALADYAR